MEEKKFIKLPDSELEVMQGIWVLNREGETCISASLVMKRFPELKRLKLTTVLTLINRLQFKGFITSEKRGRSNCYTPIINEEEYKRFVAADFLEKVYLGDSIAAITAVIESSNLTNDEQTRIKALIAY